MSVKVDDDHVGACLAEDLTEQQVTGIRGWLKALRGGEYAQGNGNLRSGDRYCCLGVRAMAEKVLVNPEGSSQCWYISKNPYMRETAVIPVGMLQEWGLTDMFASILMSMNDGDDLLDLSAGCSEMLNPVEERVHSFLEIADHIESVLNRFLKMREEYG